MQERSHRTEKSVFSERTYSRIGRDPIIRDLMKKIDERSRIK